ncbi:serine hydrolase [Paenibacillus sp. GCM10027626]|uniref:serine hydrolase n=1 Tax=Paenibacillus sp. GCM10027626 TaxID=3273411 RepID=UPI0036453382
MPILPAKKKRSWLALALVAVLILPAPAYAAATPASPAGATDAKEVETFMDGFFKRKDIRDTLAGAVVVIVKGDKTLLKKGYGYANIESRTPVDPDKTLFRLASVSKTFTATALMQLAEQKKVDLNRDIGAYLADLRIPNETGAPLTLKHLLTHTSGFDYTEAAEDEGPPQDVYPLDAYIKDNLPGVIRKPGEAYRYDNYGYNLIGYIVQNAAKKPFEQFVAENIFAPLRMTNSYFGLTSDVEQRLATPYDGAGEPLPQYATLPNFSPDGGLISTGADMARFMIAELNGGKLDGVSILSEQSLKEMQQTSVSIHPDIPGVGYGLESSFPVYANGQFVIDKSGAASGFQSHLWLLPERKTGLFIALNSSQNARTVRAKLFQSFMDHYFPQARKPGEQVSPIKQTKEQLRRLEGTYRDLRLPMWHYEITARDGGLTVSGSNGEHILKQLKELLFEDENGQKAAFKEDGKGNIAYFAYNKSDSWAEKLPAPRPYRDVPAAHPYAKFIYYVQQQGLLGTEDSPEFRPEQQISRGQFVGLLMRLGRAPLSAEPTAFADTADSPYAAEIAAALEAGIVSGTPSGKFEPERTITRQEAALIMARALIAGFGSAGAAALEAKLAGDTAGWALKGVQTAVARGYFGPEVKQNADGSVDFRSKQPLLRQEAAAMLYHFP